MNGKATVWHSPLVLFVVVLQIVKRLHIGMGFVLDPLLGRDVCLFVCWLALCPLGRDYTFVCKIWLQFVWLWPLGRDKRDNLVLYYNCLVCWLCSFGKRWLLLLLCIGVQDLGTKFWPMLWFTYKNLLAIRFWFELDPMCAYGWMDGWHVPQICPNTS